MRRSTSLTLATAFTFVLLISLTAAASIGAPVLAQRGVVELAQDAVVPRDPAPPITLPTEGGDLELGGGINTGESYVLIGYSPLSDLSELYWTSSVEKLLAESPADANYVFMSYADTPDGVQADIDRIRTRMDAAIGALPDEVDRQHWADHVHYVTVNPMTLQGPFPDMLADWGPVLPQVSADWVDGDGVTHTLATGAMTDSGWAKPLTETGPVTGPLAWYGGLACADEEPVQDVAEKIALIERGTCPFTEKAANAEKHGAVAALLFTDDRPKGSMGGSCDPCPDIPIVMIDRPPGLALVAALEAGLDVTTTLAPVEVPIEGMAIDHASRVREFGSIPYPFNNFLVDGGVDPVDALHSVALEAQGYHFEHGLEMRLANEETAGEVTVVPVIDGEWAADPGWAGVKSVVDVELPDAATMATFDTLEVDLSIACADHRHANCPAWDYIVNLYLCHKDDPDRCNIEVGRWITPYWSGGRWLTDITPMLGLLSEGGAHRLAFYTQQRYMVDLSFRLSNRDRGTTPKRAYDLNLNGGAFWNEYNKRFHPVQFFVPEWAEKVEIASVITGHGFGKDAENCAEFCNHEHEYRINDSVDVHFKDHPTAERVYGCLEKVPDGVVPNQGGTWVYGRAAWCPGLEVQPWVIDITDEVNAGDWNELHYRGLFDGEDYVAVKGPDNDPNDGFDARITMRAYVVYSAGEEVEAEDVTPPYWTIPATLYLPAADRLPELNEEP